MELLVVGDVRREGPEFHELMSAASLDGVRHGPRLHARLTAPAIV